MLACSKKITKQERYTSNFATYINLTKYVKKTAEVNCLQVC